MKNYAFLLLFVAFLSCKKETVKEDEVQTKPLTTSDLLTKEWKKQTYQVLENGYDHTVKADPFSALWTFKKGGELSLKECTDCSVISAIWSLSTDNKKLTIVISPIRKIEYSIVSLSADKLVVQAVDLIGACGPFDTTGEPGWVAPACPTGLVQYELTAVK